MARYSAEQESARPSSDPPRVLHVRLDDRGGGATHVKLLRTDSRVGGFEAIVPTTFLTGSPRRTLTTVVGLTKRLRELRPSIVHGHGLRATTAAALPALLTGTPMVVTMHGVHTLRRNSGWRMAPIGFLHRLVLSRARAIIVLNGGDKKLLLENRIPEQKIRLIHAGFTLPQRLTSEHARATLGLPPDADLALWLGRFTDEKDPLTFAQAFTLLPPDGNIQGVMVGDGPLFARTKQLVKRAGAAVHLLGWKDDPSLAYSAADVFVNTSKWEGLSIALLEAASSGLPLILASSPGNRELVDSGVPATLFEAGDVVGLSETLVRAFGDRGALRSIGDEVSRIATDRFSAETMLQDVRDVYLDVVSGEGRR